MPLNANGQIIGVMVVGFCKALEWMPTERKLMRAIADRPRSRLTAPHHRALREREARIAELSGHLLKAQEEERRRISRELHDETGQGLMVIRLYLENAERGAEREDPKGQGGRDGGGSGPDDRGHPAHHFKAFAYGHCRSWDWSRRSAKKPKTWKRTLA